jgi:predicted metal-dependent hydrolase
MCVRSSTNIRVAVPRGVSFRIAGQFARSKAEWLKKSVAGMKKREEISKSALSGKKPVTGNEAKKILRNRLEEIAGKHGFRYNRVSIRAQKTRWGSCSSRNDISLNIKLAKLPETLRDYIILHELVHTRVKNHGQAFQEEMLRAEPRSEDLKQQLKKYCLDVL